MGARIETISTMPVMRRLMRMAEEIAEDNLAEFNNLQAELDHAFAQLSHNVAQETAADES